MVRSYRPDPIPPDVVQRIVRTIRRAPSAGFSQGTRLLVVTDQGRRAEVAEAIAAGAWTDWIATAPVHVVVLVREDDYHDRYRQPDKLQAGREIEWPVPYWFVDAGAALMLLLLAAIDEGLAAGFFGVGADEMAEFRRLLELPDDLAVVGVVTVGYEAPDRESEWLTSRFTQMRKPLEEIVQSERWGSERGR